MGIFPDDASVIRLVSMLAIEANDEWMAGRCYMSRQSMEPLLAPRAETPISHKINHKEVNELVAA